MPWRKISTADFKFSPVELATLQGIAGANDGLTNSLNNVVDEFIGAMNAAGYPTNSDGTVPDQIRQNILARSVWLWLNDFGSLKSMKTDGRKNTADAAEAALKEIRLKTYGAIEPPADPVSSSGNWNSENKLILRTHGVPNPSQQYPPSSTQPGYANPDAPADN